MTKTFKQLRELARGALRGDGDIELLSSTSHSVMMTVGVIYAVWHFTAMLVWPEIFSPSLWLCSLIVAASVGVALVLLPRALFLGQLAWFVGMFAAVMLAYALYGFPEIPLLLCLMPLIASAMMGLRRAVLVELSLLALAAFWNGLPFLPPLPGEYSIVLALLSLAMAFLGWGLAANLLSAIEASSYHYRLARQHLEETRQHRAEISVLNKELSKSNFQLDRLNKMLSSAYALAEEAHQERDRFSMAVSHELRSPLNFVIAFSDLMVNSPETYAPLEDWPPGLYEDIQEVYRSSSHLHSLINDILDMGKLDARQMVLLREKASLEQIIESVREMVEPEVAKKGLTITVEVAPDLPALYIDRTRIRQVLINLVTNALRFTEQGGITLRAFPTLTDWVRVEVEDTGTGISEEDIPKVFSEFRQVGNENWRRKEGSGLGLSIGRRFIELHGGQMDVRSELGRGSCFFFTLPVREPAVAELDTMKEDWLASAARVQGDRTPLVLFLSPDPFWARIFSEGLGDYRVMILSSIDQLQQACTQYYPRAVLIDQSLAEDPQVQAFLANPPYDLPAITFPLPVNLNRETNLPEGVVRYLVKPISRQLLIDVVEELGPEVKTLLIVDDDPAMLRFVTQTLRPAAALNGGAAFDLLTAEDGSQAIEILRSQPVDAILLDLDLPHVSGLEVIERLQTDPDLHPVPIIIISANDLPQSLTPQQRSRFEVLVNRPFARKELVDLITSVLEKSSARPRPMGEIKTPSPPG